MRHAIAILAFVPVVAHADPLFELGQSDKGGRRGVRDAQLELIPVVGRHGGGVAGWEASYNGMPVDHEEAYELMGRPDLARAYELREQIGAVAILGGIAMAVGAGFTFRHHEAVTYALLGGAVVSANVGAYFFTDPDPVSPYEAQQLVVSAGGRF
jgi:hypothetical protein